MPVFLSDEWVDALDRAVSADPELARRAKGTTLVIQYVVTDDDEAPRTYHLEVRDGTVHARTGPASDPTVLFTQDRATASAVATGAERAQTAFMAGRLRLGGDVTALVAHRALLALLHDVTASVRADTEHGRARATESGRPA